MIMAGLRVATVSTVALATIGAIVSYGGLGNLLLQAVGNQFKAQIFAASLLCVVLAVVLDLILVIVQRLSPRGRAMPVTRRLPHRRGDWSGPTGIGTFLVQQLLLTVTALVVAVIIGLPLRCTPGTGAAAASSPSTSPTWGGRCRLGESRRPDERCETGGEPLLGRRRDEERVAPERGRPGPDRVAADRPGQLTAVVMGIERAPGQRGQIPTASRACSVSQLRQRSAVADNGFSFLFRSTSFEPIGSPGLAPCPRGRLPRRHRAGSLSLSRCRAGIAPTAGPDYNADTESVRISQMTVEREARAAGTAAKQV